MPTPVSFEFPGAYNKPLPNEDGRGSLVGLPIFPLSILHPLTLPQNPGPLPYAIFFLPIALGTQDLQVLLRVATSPAA